MTLARAVVCVATVLVGLGACRDERPVSVEARADATVASRPDDAARARYGEARAALARDREVLARRYASATEAARGPIVAVARARLERAFREDAMPAWAGTAWDFNGTTATPGEGAIACGHFVASVLVDLGFDVPRLRLGRLASEAIARTFVPKGDLLRFSDRSADDVVAAVLARGDGVYALGLDRHAGFLDVHDGAVAMCHASPFGDGGVTCEPAATAAAFASRYRVAGRLFDDAMVAGWLEGRRFVPFEPVR